MLCVILLRHVHKARETQFFAANKFLCLNTYKLFVLVIKKGGNETGGKIWRKQGNTGCKPKVGILCENGIQLKKGTCKSLSLGINQPVGNISPPGPNVQTAQKTWTSYYQKVITALLAGSN